MCLKAAAPGLREAAQCERIVLWRCPGRSAGQPRAQWAVPDTACAHNEAYQAKEIPSSAAWQVEEQSRACRNETTKEKKKGQALRASG